VAPPTDSDARTRCRECFRDSKTDPACTAGHDCILALEKCIHVLMLIRY
jgi:hypothetical protein